MIYGGNRGLRRLVAVTRDRLARSRGDSGSAGPGRGLEGATAPVPAPGFPVPLPRERDCGRSYRTRYAITAYIGSNGSGKTLCMVHDTLPSLYAGRMIYTTVPLTWPDGTTPPNVVMLHDWSQILNARPADILLDEVASIASSRETDALPPQIATLLQQLRKRDLVLRWTAPSWSRADKILRETTRTVTICYGYFSRPAEGSRWRSNRLFRFLSYDASDYTELDINGARRRFDPQQSSWFVLSRHVARLCYNTLDSVSTIGTVLLSGRCAVCGGRRRVPECTCDDYQALKARRPRPSV